MHEFTGKVVEEAVPGMPVEVLGFDGVSDAGEFVQVVENDRRARQMAQERADRLHAEALARRQARKVSLDEVFARVQEGDIKELNIVLKADVAGSLEALQDELAKVPQERVAINIIHSQTGGINESDVMLASASDAIIIGFNVRPLADARKAAEREGINIRAYSVVYEVTEDLRDAMEGLLEAVEVEETIGEALVEPTFEASQGRPHRRLHRLRGPRPRDASVRLVREGTVSGPANWAPCAASKTTCKRSRKARSAASCSTATLTSRRTTSSSSSRPGRSSSPRLRWPALACGASTRCSARSWALRSPVI